MSPELIAYLQSQQQQQQFRPERPEEFQDEVQYQQTIETPEPYNPFDSGIQKAIGSARQSLGMTQDQGDAAMRRSLLAFGDNIGRQPKQRGLLANFASVGKALSPAILAHDEAASNALRENQTMANQILAYQQAQRAEQMRAQQHAEAAQERSEEKDWGRKYQQQLLELQRQKYAPREGGQQAPLLGSDEYSPITTKSERLLYAKDKKSSAEILHELEGIQKSYDEFSNLVKDNIIHPMSPYYLGAASNKAKDFFGYFTDNSDLREETRKRKALEAKLGKFAVELERKIKGGVLSEGMVRRFEQKGLLPAISDERTVFEEKLSNLMRELKDRHEAAETSLRYGLHLSPLDIQDIQKKQRLLAQQNSTPSKISTEEAYATEEPPLAEEAKVTDTVMMRDRQGNKYQIPREEVLDAQQEEGFVIDE